MWKMIIGQAIFQLAVTLVLNFAGPKFLAWPDAQLRSVVFNCFVWMQVFNMFNNRRLDNRFNILAGVLHNWFFIAICAIMVGCQIAIAFVGGQAFSIVRITGSQWAVSVVVAVLCLPWAVLVRLFPDAWFERAAKFVGRPVVLVYRPLSRASSRFGRWVGRAFRSKKRNAEIESAAVENSNESGSDSDAVRRNDDPEKGRGV